ncbi:MAG TPA: metal ABC transporter permease, partial [Pseudomonadales bacterium]|nr:metal ABC transporter permease [Pseudomonadales bacterium]
MSDFLQALASQPFLRQALFAGLLASVACGVIGSYVVVKRIGYLAGGIAHSVLGGMGVAYFFGGDPMDGALVAAVLAALVISWVNLHWREHEDTVIGALWAAGMAVGILLMARTPGYNVDLMSYLFGNILLVPSSELWRMAWLDLIVLLLVLLFQKQFLAVVFDEEFARLRGIR